MSAGHSRRSALRIGGIALSFGLGGCVSAPTRTEGQAGRLRTSATPSPTETGESWPEFGFDARNTGYDPNGTGPIGDVSVLWQFDTGSPTALCSPVVVDGTVFTGSSGSPAHLFALDAASGEERWRVETSSIRAAPTVVGDTLYLGDHSSAVYAIDTTDGTERWKTFVGQRITESAPAVTEGTVFVGTWKTDLLFVALDAETGEVRWRFGDPDVETTIQTSPAVADGRVFFGTMDGTIFALDADSGEEAWRRETDVHLRSSPAVHDGVVYVGVETEGELWALDAATGETRFTTPLTGTFVESSPAIAESTVYVSGYRAVGSFDGGNEAGGRFSSGTLDTDGGPRPAGFVQAIDAEGGSIEWTATVSRNYRIRSSPAVVGNGIYVGLGEGLLGLSRAGERLWRVSFDEPVRSSPAVADGRAFINGRHGHVYAVGARG